MSKLNWWRGRERGKANSSSSSDSHIKLQRYPINVPLLFWICKLCYFCFKFTISACSIHRFLFSLLFWTVSNRGCHTKTKTAFSAFDLKHLSISILSDHRQQFIPFFKRHFFCSFTIHCSHLYMSLTILKCWKRESDSIVAVCCIERWSAIVRPIHLYDIRKYLWIQNALTAQAQYKCIHYVVWSQYKNGFQMEKKKFGNQRLSTALSCVVDLFSLWFGLTILRLRFLWWWWRWWWGISNKRAHTHTLSLRQNHCKHPS